MRVTTNQSVASMAGVARTAQAVNGITFEGTPRSGLALIANNSNSASWASNVSRITANGSNVLLGPFVNFASGPGLAFGAASNTLTLTGLPSVHTHPESDISGLVSDLATKIRRYATNIGNGILTSITVTHNLGTLDVVVSTYDNATGLSINPATMTRVDVNNITLTFGLAPGTNAYRCIVLG